MDAELRYLNQAFADCGLVEIRHAVGKQWTAGLFDNPGTALRAIEERRPVGNLYTSLNQPNPRPVRNAFGGHKLLGNDDIARIRRIVFDFDPERPTGTSSTEGEVRRACECRDAVVAAMRAMDWPAPAFGESGNGAHAVWRCNIVATDDWRAATAILYAGARQQFAEILAESGVLFDTAIRNPGRIWRLYGCVNRKGVPTNERPHRVAKIRIPSTWECVKARQIEAAVRLFTPTVVNTRAEIRSRSSFSTSAGDYATLDVVSWFKSHGLYRRHVERHIHAVTCPWSSEHSLKGGAAATVIFETTGSWPGFHCKHSHCADRSIRDVMTLLGDADQFCARQRGVRHG